MAFTGFPIPTITTTQWGLPYSPRDPFYGAKGDGIADDSGAIQATINACSAAGGGTVMLTTPSAFYKVNTGLTVPANVTLRGDGWSCAIKPGASMTSLVKITGNNFARVRDIQLANQSSFATNGVEFNVGTPGNNDNKVENCAIVGGFINNVLNTNTDSFVVRGCFFQNNTGWDIRSVDSGVNAIVEGNYSLGGNGGCYFSKTVTQPEGTRISNNCFLPVGGAGIQFDGGLQVTITDNILDQLNAIGIFLNGTLAGTPIASFKLKGNWCGPKAGATLNTVGVDVQGNASDIVIDTQTCPGFTLAGIRLRSGAIGGVQRVHITGATLYNNGTGVGSADLLIDTSIAAAIYSTRDCQFGSSGGSVVSIREGVGAVGTHGPGNNYLVAPVLATTSFSVPTQIGLGPWKDYSASLSAVGNGAAVDGTNGSAINYAKYQQIGKTIIFGVDFTLRNNSGTGTVTFNLPIVPNGSFGGGGQETLVNGHGVTIQSSAGNIGVTARDASGNVNWAQASRFVIGGSYEVS